MYLSTVRPKSLPITRINTISGRTHNLFLYLSFNKHWLAHSYVSLLHIKWIRPPPPFTSNWLVAPKIYGFVVNHLYVHGKLLGMKQTCLHHYRDISAFLVILQALPLYVLLWTECAVSSSNKTPSSVTSSKTNHFCSAPDFCNFIERTASHDPRSDRLFIIINQ